MNETEPPADDLAGLDAGGLLSAGFDADAPSVAEIAAHFPNYELLGTKDTKALPRVRADSRRRVTLERSRRASLGPPELRAASAAVPSDRSGACGVT